MHLANFLSLFLIFLPAFFANASPVVAKNIPGIRQLSWPIHVWLFWKNKTVRGLITGILVGMIIGLILYSFRYFFVQHLSDYTWIYNLYSSWQQSIFIGWVLATWALLGDMAKSFVKRRLGRKPWSMFQPWDGIDYMVGAILCLAPWYSINTFGIIFLLILGPLLSLLMNALAYSIGWKECWY